MTSVPVRGRQRATPRMWLPGRHGLVCQLRRQVTSLSLVAALGSASGAPPLTAQAAVAVPHPLLAMVLNDLAFGTVLAGVPSSVNVHDPRKAALFEIQGPPDGGVRVELLLPSALTNSGGALLPIIFGPADGFADFSRGRPPRGTTFNPHAPLISTLGPNGRIYVRLGGTVLPGRPQSSGAYSATIFVTVYDIGT